MAKQEKPELQSNSLDYQISLVSDAFRHNKNLNRHLPKQPCLIPELIVIPLDRDRCIIHGSAQPFVFRAPGAIDTILAYLRVLDGQETIEQLASSFTELDADAQFDVITALHRDGLLQDGKSAEINPDSRAISSFCSRYNGDYRHHANGSEALRRLNQTQLCIAVGGAPVPEIKSSFDNCGLGSVEQIQPDDAGYQMLMNADFAVFVNHGDLAAVEPLMLAAHEQRTPYFLVQYGQDAVSLGPLVYPGFTAGYDCLRQAGLLLSGQLAETDLQFWTHFAAHEIVNQLSRIASPYYVERCIKHCVGAEIFTQETLIVPRMPGSQTSGISADPACMDNQALVKAWTHHTSVRRPLRKLISSKAHQQHFSASNILLTRQMPTTQNKLTRIALPEPDPVGNARKAFDALNLDEPSARLTLTSLNAILQSATGYMTLESGSKRIAPTGGGLGSPETIVMVRQLEGLADGCYRYFGPDHSLEPLHNVDLDMLDMALGSENERRQAVIFTVSWYEKLQSKYGPFARNLAHYDAGIANEFLLRTCRGYDVDAVQYSQMNLRLVSRIFGIEEPTPRYIPVCAFGLGESIDSGELGSPRPSLRVSKVVGAQTLPHSMKGRDLGETLKQSIPSGISLLDQMKTRRARYDFVREATPSKIIKDIIDVAWATNQEWNVRSGIEIEIRPFLLRQFGDGDLAAGIYATSPDDPARWDIRRSALSNEEINQCINQVDLAESANILVMVGNVKHAVEAYGEYGYFETMLRAGAVTGAAWLAAHMAGLGGCAGGGIIDGGLMEFAKCDGFSECPTLGFAFGAVEGIDQ